MKFYYQKVDGLGDIGVSRIAQNQAYQAAISDRDFEAALYRGEIRKEGFTRVYRELNDIRLRIDYSAESFKGIGMVTEVSLVNGDGA